MEITYVRVHTLPFLYLTLDAVFMLGVSVKERERDEDR